MPSVKNASIAPSSPAYLRRLCAHLERSIFTDFEQAHAVFSELKAAIHPGLPFDIRLAYYRSAAFLENQWQRWEPALAHARQAIAILENLADAPALAEMWADVSAVQVNQRAWSAAQESLDRAHHYLDPDSPPRVRANVTCREGFLHLHLGNLNQALGCFQEAEKDLMGLDASAERKDFYLLTLVLSGLGTLYERLGDKQKSLDAFRRVLPIAEEHHLRPRLPWHFLHTGRVALALDNAVQAREHFERSLQFASEGEEEVKTLALGNLGILAFLADRPDEAFVLFDQAAAQYEHPDSEDDFTNLSKIESWRAGAMLRKGDREQGQAHLEKAYEYGIKGRDIHHLSQICLNLSQMFVQDERYERAYFYQHRATQLTTEHYEQLRDRDREELEARHLIERSRQDAQMARLRVASLQLRALRAQMNPHFMFNALNAIQGLVTSGRNNEAESYIAKFAKMMRQTLEYSDLEVVPLEQEVEFLERYLDINRKLRFRDQLDYQIAVSPELERLDIYLPTMILQPFVENAVEHGLRPRLKGKLRIEITLGKADGTLCCIIEDDGVGYLAGRAKQSDQMAFQKHRSRGMDITHERLALLHQLQRKQEGQFVVITDLGEQTDSTRTGTRVEVTLPIMEEEGL